MSTSGTCHIAILSILFACSCGSIEPRTEETHLGGCILLAPAEEAPRDPYARGDVVPTDEYPPFTKKLSVCGITLIGRDEISNGFMRQVARTIEEMFPQDAIVDAARQREVLTHLHRYRTTIPIFLGDDFGFASEEEEAAWDRTVGRNSICDIIMEGVPGQVMEVIEHILHHVTDVGLHYTFPDEWGISRESELCRAMEEAIEAGYYEIEQYAELEHEPEIHDRVLLQEFAYWIITCAWNLQEPYGPEDSEWKVIKTAADLEARLPRSHELVRGTIPGVMAPPSRATLDALVD